jgi:hypothetical protein
MKRAAYHDYAALLAKPPAQRTYTEKLDAAPVAGKGLCIRLAQCPLHFTLNRSSEHQSFDLNVWSGPARCFR